MEKNDVKYYPLFIDGKWVEPKKGKTKDIVSPATGEVIGKYAIADKDDTDLAIAAAKKAYYEGWKETPVKERSTVLLQLADMVDANKEKFAYLEAIDVGKPMEHAIFEAELVSEALRFFAGIARNPEGKSCEEYERDVTSIIRREPLGVTAGICPWNYPLYMMTWKFAPALAAGNTSVIKASSDAPLSSLLFAELSKDIIPAGVLNVITGPGGEVGEALCKHPDVRLVSMTGSSATGKRIAEASASTLKRVHLELGGKAPLVALADADIEALVATVKEGSFYNAGQDCGQGCRIIIAEDIYDEFVDKLVEAVESINVGAIEDPATEMACVVSADQLEKVKGFVDRAVKAGAVVKTGGKVLDRAGCFYAPTVVTDCDQKSEIVQDEIFGPVVTVQKFKTEDEAMEMANDTVYGLSASVWTKDVNKMMTFVKKLEYGTVSVNTHSFQTIEMPWGGYKESGYGKDMSGYALEDYTQIKHVAIATE